MTMSTHRYLKPAVVAAALAVALPATAQIYREDYDSRPDFARVVKVDAIVSHASSPVTRETCWQTPTTYRYRPSYTYYRDFDDDDAPDAVTVEGQYEQVNTPSERCRTTTAWRDSDRIMGYEVTYRYGGREYTTRMDHDPGNRLRVRVDTDYRIEPDE
jgi:uncharacterized protein YcfJ